MAYLLVLTTMPDSAAAERLATALVEAGLAACVNITPAMQSIYRWQSKTQKAAEYLMLIKTTEARYRAVEGFIRANHPFELPEVIALPIAAGLRGYLDWIESCCEETQ